MEENVAGALCYAGFWITGLIFFLVDKRPSVRFHAVQSMVVFGGLHIIYIVLGEIFFDTFGFGGFGLYSLASLLFEGLRILGLVLWILLMYKAYQKEQFKLPIVGDIAKGIASK